MNATAHSRAITDGTVEMSLRYRSGDTSNASYWGYVWVRYADGSNRIRLSFEPGKVALLEQYLGAYTTLDQDTSFTTAQDTWYNYRIVADGAHIEVWRNEDGQMPVKVLETNSSQMTTTASIGFATTANSTSDFSRSQIPFGNANVAKLGLAFLPPIALPSASIRVICGQQSFGSSGQQSNPAPSAGLPLGKAARTPLLL